MSTRAETVLVVEDDVDLGRVEEMVLSGSGYRVVLAREGATALEQLARERPVLILLDMRMPGMNGWQFMSSLRARYGHAIPVVVVTAAEDAPGRAAEVEADGCLAKPFEIDDLLRVVERYAGHGGTAESGH